MRLRSALVAAALLALPLTAKAQPVAGPYISLGAGMNFLQDELVKPSTTLGSPKLTTHFINPGLGSEGSIGFGLGNGLRFEVEGFYNYNHLHKLSGTPFPTEAGGEQQQYGGMFNALYDFDIGMPFMFPYVGVGVGYQWTDWHNVHAYGVNFPARLDIDDTADGTLAYQGIFGVAFPVLGIPGLSLTAEYRFIGTPDNNQKFNAVVTTNFPHTVTHGQLNMHNEFEHQALFGIRYAFAVPPPPPPPPPPVVTPAPAPARTYLVFFDWDRADLTDRARQIIAEAAESSRHVQYTRIEVNGYTDRSGTVQYNLRLSVRRAQNVAAELVRDGVPRGAISIHGYGESNPLVPTADGVREPQNRRVEIILR
jgi:opacity protein-like surface antigen